MVEFSPQLKRDALTAAQSMPDEGEPSTLQQAWRHAILVERGYLPPTLAQVKVELNKIGGPDVRDDSVTLRGLVDNLLAAKENKYLPLVVIGFFTKHGEELEGIRARLAAAQEEQHAQEGAVAASR